MKNVRKALRGAFAAALIFTFLLPVGGAMLGVGLGFGIPAVWGIGIGFMATGFYGCPIAWVAYGDKKGLYRVVEAIEEEHLYTVQEIGAQLGISEKEVRNRLDTCFNKRYLVGYKKSGDGVTLNENAALAEEDLSAVCEACGARFTYKRGTRPACPYCGTPCRRD